MKSKARNLSVLVDKQLPAFISSEYPLFSSFIEKYYEHLELPGNPIDLVNNLTKYRDVDTYNVLKESTTLVNIETTSGGVTINVEDTFGFPEKNGYLQIQDEVIFYESKTDNSFLNCYRNVSYTTKIGDLYESSTFKNVSYDEVGISSIQYPANTNVLNISNLFLFALVKNFEKEYLSSFPEKNLKKDVNKSLLIKNIKEFYSTKGTDQSIRFIFNSVVSKDPLDIPTVYYPKDSVYKASTSEWITKYALKVKLNYGDITKIVGEKIVQNESIDKKYAFAVVDNFQDLGDGYYELILAEESVVGEFDILGKTVLTKDLLPTDNNVNVFSTLGWNTDSGEINIGSEVISYRSKSIGQFTIDTRSTPLVSYSAGTEVSETSTVFCEYIDDNGVLQTVSVSVYGILYNILPQTAYPFSKEGDTIQISSSGSKSKDRVIFDLVNNRIRWFLNETNQNTSSQNALIQNSLDEVLCNVSSIFEDSQYFYIATSGYPDYDFGKLDWNVSLQDQKHLKIIKKNPEKTTEIYPTKSTDVGIFLNGVLAQGYKDVDEELVVYGEITNVELTSGGSGYKKPPYVLIQDGAGEFVAQAEAILNGEVVDSIYVINSGEGFFPPVPSVTITSGRNAIAEPIVTRDKITGIKIIDPGEYYSSPPEVIIKDYSGLGRFAKYESIISDEGKIIGFKQIDQGKFYNQETTVVEIVAVGGGATAKSIVRSWRKNLFSKYRSQLDDNYGFYFQNPDTTLGYGYKCLANPKTLRQILGDDSINHSPILGYAYDGNPIYGPYGYSDPLDKNANITRMTSSYILRYDRPKGPPTSQYPLGSFVEDYAYIHRSGSLDENNGRYCVTPEYPEGTYAYFISVDSLDNPVFPYIIGSNFYSIPVDSNYTKAISQKDLPKNVLRVNTVNTPVENGSGVLALVDSISTGSVSGVVIEDSDDNFSVGCVVETEYGNTLGEGVSAKVSSLKGKQVETIESRSAINIISENNAYFFDGDIVTQQGTNALGEVVGNVFDSKNIVLRNTSGNFNKTNSLQSTIEVVSLFLNQSSSYTANSDIILTNGKQQGITRIINNTLSVGINPFVDGDVITFSVSAHGILVNTLYYVVESQSSSFKISSTLNGTPLTLSNTNLPGIVAFSEVARGMILETTSASNVVKVKVLRGQFNSDSQYYLRSVSLGDSIGSKIITVLPLSSNIIPFTLNKNIAIVKTSEDHKIAIGDKVNVDINPDDSLSTTTYYVRGRIYQQLKLQTPTYNSFINDTGIGKIEVLNNGSYLNVNAEPIGDYAYSTSGNATLTNVELIFADITKCRDNEGRIVGNSSRSVIGRPGDINNARATVTITNGIVSNIIITNKGSLYKKGDILTASAVSLDRNPQSSNTRFLILDVDHVGLGLSQTRVFVSNVNNLSVDDYLQIGEEIVKITDINFSNSYIDIIRSQFNTVAQNHFNLQEVSAYNFRYNFTPSFKTGNSESDASIFSYDPETHVLTLVYNLGQNLNSINDLSSGDTFFDESSPKKIVVVKDNIESASLKYEFSLDSNDLADTWVKNPELKLQKYYKYKFDTSHITLRGSHLDFSPSKNYNIITTESVKNDILPGNSGSFLTVKFGFGSNIASNNFESKVNIDYTKYFYFDKNGIIDSDNTSISLIDDPLQQEKTVVYVTPNRFVYGIDSTPEYDGTGDMSYTTTSISSSGKIDKISVLNGGFNFVSIPSVYGISPSVENECIVDVNWNNISNKIISVDILLPGKKYVNPKAIVISESGSGAKFEISTDENGSIKGIITLNGGIGYLEKPIIKIVEGNLKCYYTSENIGTPKSIRILANGKDFNKDFSTSRSYSGATILYLKNIVNSFEDGEIIRQYVNGILVATFRLAPNGWNKNTNIIRVVDIDGEIVDNGEIIGSSKNGRGTVVSSFVSIFSTSIKSYYDNLGYYASDKGKLSSNYQKLSDNYFYQDYSYVIKSKTPINNWRKVITDTTHPAGFKLFGDLTIESSGSSPLPSTQPNISHVSNIQLWDPNKNKITISYSSRKITTSTVSVANQNVERGRGTLYALSYDTGETSAFEFKLSPDFNGYFDANGNRNGNTVFTVLLSSNNKPYAVPKEENIILSLDGIIQDPKSAFTISGTQIIFNEPPLGYRDIDGNSITKQNYKEGVDTPAQRVVGRIIRLKDTQSNNSYFRKIKDISTEFDGEKKIFDLYYENNEGVTLPSGENLMVYIDGVLQKAGITPTIPIDRSYYIRRAVTPNQIVFMEAPKPEQNFSGIAVGGYERISIDYSYVNETRTGPFPLKSLFFDRRIVIDDDRNILVFVNDVLQRPRRNYFIANTTISFTDPIKEGQEIEILYLYGIQSAKSVLAFNTEVQPFLNRYNIIVNGEVPYVENNFRVKSVSTEGIVRSVSYIYNMNREVTQTVISVETQNKQFTSTENLVFTNGIDVINVNSSSISYVVPFTQNDNAQEIVTRSRAGFLSGTTVPYRYKNSLNSGDFIKIDGEDAFREIISVPDVGIKTDYRIGDDVNSSYYSRILVSNYNFSQRGEGLDVVPTIENGKVVSLSWGKIDWNQYVSTNSLPTPPGYGYENYVQLEFVAQPVRDEDGEIISSAQGGGAKAYAIIHDGIVMDVVLYSQGDGYLTAPRVYVTRGYDLLRKRKQVNTYEVKLDICSVVESASSLTSSIFVDVIRPLDLQLLSVLSSALGGEFLKVTQEHIVTIQKKIDTSDISSYTESISTINLQTSISSYNTIYTFQQYRTINLSCQPAIISTSSELQNNIFSGVVDKYRLGITEKYDQNVLGQTVRSFTEGFRYMDVGYANVSGFTIGDFSNYYPEVEIDGFAGILDTTKIENSDIPWNIGYPSIQEHGAIIDSPLSPTDTTIYIPNTSRFADSGYLMLNGEIVRYTYKLSDRFVGVARGQAGTTAKSHLAGSYLRTTIVDTKTSWSWNGSGLLFSFNEAIVSN